MSLANDQMRAQIRASYAKTLIGCVKKLAEPQRTQVLERIGAELRTEAREHGMLDWMPAERFILLVQTLEAALGGPLPARQFWNDCLRASLERRLLAPLRIGAIAVYGDSPRSLLKMTPQAWDLVSRRCGTCRTEDQTQHGIVLHFTDLPSELRNVCMLPIWLGGTQACIDRMKRRGAASARIDHLRDGSVDIIAGWE